MTLVQEREAAIRSVLRYSHLPKSFIDFLLDPKNNPAQFAYHNSLHAQTVAYNCILGAKQALVEGSFLIELVVAALVHDWNHSGGEFEDEMNIRRAENAYLRMSFKYKLHLNDDNVLRLIRATKFPHDAAKTIEEEIIQDSDLLQYAHGDAAEWVKRYNEEAGTEFNNEDVACWMESQHYNTIWGKDLKREAANNLLSY